MVVGLMMMMHAGSFSHVSFSPFFPTSKKNTICHATPAPLKIKKGKQEKLSILMAGGREEQDPCSLHVSLSLSHEKDNPLGHFMMMMMMISTLSDKIPRLNTLSPCILYYLVHAILLLIPCFYFSQSILKHFFKKKKKKQNIRNRKTIQ